MKAFSAIPASKFESEYPEVFQVSPSDPKEMTNVTPELSSYLQNVLNIYEFLRASPKYISFLSNIIQVGLYNEAEAQRIIVANAFLALAQQIVCSYQTGHGTVGNWSVISRHPLPFIQAFRINASQYGETNMPLIGEKLQIKDYDQTIKRIIRVADDISTGTSDRWTWTTWESILPLDKYDTTTDDILHVLLNKVLANCIPNTNIRDESPLFTNLIPPTLNALYSANLIGTELWNAIQWLYGNRPATAQQWINDLANHGPVLMYPPPPGYDSQNRGLHLSWNSNFNQRANHLFSVWDKFEPSIRDYFKLIDVKLLDGTIGQPTQIGEPFSYEDETINGIRYIYATSAKAASMAACYYPTNFYFPRKKDAKSRYGGDYPNLLESNPRSKSEMRDKFVSGSFK